MRTLIYETILSAVADTDVADRVYSSSALGAGDVPTVPQKPFILITMGVTGSHRIVDETSDAEDMPADIYFYDEIGSYIRIDALIRTVEAVIKQIAGTTSSTGAFCLGVHWMGVSQDFIDETYEAAARFASFSVTGSNHKEF